MLRKQPMNDDEGIHLANSIIYFLVAVRNNDTAFRICRAEVL